MSKGQAVTVVLVGNKRLFRDRRWTGWSRQAAQ